MDFEYREPTNNERQQVREAFEEHTGMGWEEGNMQNRPFVIVEGFMTDGPGYTGRIGVVIGGMGGAISFGFEEEKAFLWRMPEP